MSHGVPNRLAYCCDGGFAVVYLDPLDGVTHEQGETPQDCLIIPTATWVLEWGRCVPTVDEDGWPDDDDLDTSAADLLEDLWSVLTELYDRRAAGTVVPGTDDTCGSVTILDAVPVEPSGGCAGWQVKVSTVLNDPGPTGS